MTKKLRIVNCILNSNEKNTNQMYFYDDVLVICDQKLKKIKTLKCVSCFSLIILKKMQN